MNMTMFDQTRNDRTLLKMKGFTLIELVVVIAILGILAAFAIPRFADMADEAHISTVEGTGGALASAVALVRSQWLANGNQAAVTNLPGFGEPNNVVDVSAEGWPTGVNGNTDPGAMTAAECDALWDELMQSNAPSASTLVGSDYRTTLNGGECRYTYQATADGHFINYDPDTGEVDTQIN